VTMIVIEINKNSSDSEGGSILLKKVLIYKYIFFEKNQATPFTSCRLANERENERLHR
jgi:hypothetical protein